MLSDQILDYNCDEEYAQTKKEKYIFNRGVKLKKRHEIARLSHLVHKICAICRCDTVVDCGSGMGHLSRALSLYYKHKVISVESDSAVITGAQKLDVQTVAALNKCKIENHLTLECPSKIHHKLDVNSKVIEPNAEFVLTGLHACGPLSNTILHQFCASPSARALVLVSCCYMKQKNEW